MTPSIRKKKVKVKADKGFVEGEIEKIQKGFYEKEYIKPMKIVTRKDGHKVLRININSEL